MPKDRPDIPKPMKREVRQRCGFGCVICGCPVYEYEHIVEWNIVKEHKAKNLTLLCNKHHGEVTRRLLSKSHVQECNEHPWNKQHKFSSSQSIYYNADTITTKMGGNIFISNPKHEGNIFIPVIVNQTPIIMFRHSQGSWLLSINMIDEHGRLYFKVVDGEIILSTDNWDVEL